MCLKVIDAETALKEIDDEDIHVTYDRMVTSTRYMNYWIIGSSLFTMVAFLVVSFIELAHIGPAYWDFDNVSFMHELYLPFNKREHYHFIIIANISISVESVILNAAIQTTFFWIDCLCVYASQISSDWLKKSSCFIEGYRGY